MKKSFSVVSAFVGFVCFFTSCNGQSENYKSIPATEFNEKIKTEPGIIVDVRTPKEFAGGHIAGSVNINLYDDDFAKQIQKLDTAKTVYLYCGSGGRSSEAAEIFFKSGFKKINNLENGIREWNEMNLPVEK